MKKFCAIACTIGFSAFWVFGGLAILSLASEHTVSTVAPLLCALGLGVGILARKRVVRMTQDVPVGQRVYQEEQTTG